jgi:rRNA maturation endonuclease Nob1
MPSDESALQGYCIKCKKLFNVKWAENLCPACEHEPMKKVLDFPDDDEVSSAV